MSLATELKEFYKDKKVFVTGHTGFKGSWLTALLLYLGADVSGYSLKPLTDDSLFDVLFPIGSDVRKKFTSEIGDIRDIEHLKDVMAKANPEIVLHLAAQPIVRTSYEEPVYTYETNVMGTVNILECVRLSDSVRSIVNVTTDKVYRNDEVQKGYKENDYLDGYDPYSNSKSCSELVTHSYKQSFFDVDECAVAVSTARAGNVIGGGDFARDRIIPDCIRAAQKGEKIIVRNPYAVRPFQHVIEPLVAYLMIAMRQWQDKYKYAGSYNIGPNEEDCVTTGTLADLFCEAWGEGQAWENICDGGPHEAGFLKLDCSKAKDVFNWEPKWNIETAIEKIVEWHKNEQDPLDMVYKQIEEYLEVI